MISFASPTLDAPLDVLDGMVMFEVADAELGDVLRPLAQLLVGTRRRRVDCEQRERIDDGNVSE